MKRVLVVDDDVSVQRHCRDILQSEGFEVACEASLGSTRRFLRNEGADVILLDLFLPDGCGFELFRTSSDLVNGVPIVAMTAVYRGSANARLITLRYPFAGLLEKPVGVGALVEAIRGILGDAYPDAPAWARGDDQLVDESPLDLSSELDAIDQILSAQPSDGQASAPQPGNADPMRYSGAFVSPLDRSDSDRAAAMEWDPTKDVRLSDLDLTDPGSDDEATVGAMIDSLQIQAADAEPTESTVVTGPPHLGGPALTQDDDTDDRTQRDMPSMLAIENPRHNKAARDSRYPTVDDDLVVPPQLDPRRVSLQGRLEATPFPAVLARLAREGESGTLLMRRDQVKKIVFLQDGVPRAIKSNLVYECLGQILVREDLISEQACQLSVERLQTERRPQGEILVEMGVLSEQDLSYALEKQFDIKMFDIFSWGVGLYQFRNVETPDTTGYSTPRNPYNLVMAGMRGGFPDDRVNFDLSVYQAHPPRLLVPEHELDQIGLDDHEMQIVRMMDGRTLSDIAGTPGAGPGVYRLVYGLICLGLLAFLAPQHIARLRR